MTNRGTATLDDLWWRNLKSGSSSSSEGDRWRRQRGRGRRRHQEAAGQHCHSPVALQPRHRAGAAPVWRHPALHPSPDPKPGALHDHALSSVMPLPQPCTPGRILPPWTSCRSSENTRRPSETEEAYAEPRINIGEEFQAVLPACDGERPPDRQVLLTRIRVIASVRALSTSLLCVP